MLTIGSLFAGIGGLELGLERTGSFRTVWQVENDGYCNQVLARHWPEVRRYGDIRECRNLPYVDIICGGFPCQDISTAGKRKGIKGERSGLWSEFARIVGETRPRFVLIENVPPLASMGLGQVLRDLRFHGYQSFRPILVEAASVGAPHRRERIFIIAVANADCPELRDEHRRQFGTYRKGQAGPRNDGKEAPLAHSTIKRFDTGRMVGQFNDAATENGQASESGGIGQDVADCDLKGLEGRGQHGECSGQQPIGKGGFKNVSHADNSTSARQREYGREVPSEPEPEGFGLGDCADWWPVERHMDGTSHGLPCGMDGTVAGWECGIQRVTKSQPFRKERLHAIGNAVVPAVAELVGRLILAFDKADMT